MIGPSGPFDFSLPLPDFSMSYEIYTGTKATEATQEVLKAIAKMSDFNVDIQAKRTGFSHVYRAICTKCQSDMSITGAVVTGDFGKEFIDFCILHRHETLVKETDEVIGRKFKNAEQC